MARCECEREGEGCSRLTTMLCARAARGQRVRKRVRARSRPARLYGLHAGSRGGRPIQGPRLLHRDCNCTHSTSTHAITLLLANGVMLLLVKLWISQNRSVASSSRIYIHTNESNLSLKPYKILLRKKNLKL